MTIESPCLKICVMDPASGLCRGCGRTLDEIAAWTGLSTVDRATITAQLSERMRAAGLPRLPQSPASS